MIRVINPKKSQSRHSKLQTKYVYLKNLRNIGTIYHNVLFTDKGQQCCDFPIVPTLRHMLAPSGIC